jgi:hypothetical protein
LKNVARDKSIEKRGRDNVHQEFHWIQGMGLLRERLGLLHLSWIQGFWINVETDSRMEGVDNDQSNEKRHRGNNLKIKQCFNPDPAKFFQVAH